MLSFFFKLKTSYAMRINDWSSDVCSSDLVATGLASRPHQFRFTHQATSHSIIIPRVSSERRHYIPFGILSADCIISDSAQAVYDAELWHLAILLSLLHMSWVRAVAGRLEMRLRYSSALCYNTFPVPALTDKNKADLTRCAEDILLAREKSEEHTYE